MSQSGPPSPTQANDNSQTAGITPTGGAAIVAPITAFPSGVPSNALVVIPLGPNGKPLEEQVIDGPMAMKMEDVWKLLGFNGPAVQVQDDQGRPIAIGLEDLLSGLEKHWVENPDDLDRARIFAQELIKYERHAKAETVLAKIVAKGGDGDDWLALGVAQLQQDKLDKAEGTLRGAQNLLKTNPYPALHLAKVYNAKKDAAAEREQVDKAIELAPNAVDAWAYLFNMLRQSGVESDAAVAEVEKIAQDPKNEKMAAPYVALQGFFAGDETTRDLAIDLAKKAVGRSPSDPLALLCLGSLYAQKGDLDETIKLMAPHEGLMTRNLQMANFYFEALFQKRDLDKIKTLLNKLATSPSKEVQQFALERSRAIAQMVQQQKEAGAGNGVQAPTA